MTRPFTGWHMAVILIAFFTIVCGVNLYMARAAIGTFGGTVVDNSYAASQKFNSWIDKANTQKALGWSVSTTLQPGRYVGVTASVGAQPLVASEVMGIIRHPLGRAPQHTLRFTPQTGGWISTTPLPAGRWRVHIMLRRGADSVQSLEDLR